jgi:hypothetical protein
MCTSRRMWFEGASGRGDRLHGVGLRSEGGDVEIGADGKAGDEHVAGEQQIILRPLQVQRGVGQRRDAGRVADADALAGDGEIGEETVLVGQIPAHAELAAAAHRRERLHFQSVLVEFQGAVQLAQAVGHIFQR